MRELCVYYCPKCGHHGFFHTKLRATCPQCDCQMDWLSTDFVTFCQMDVDERDEVLARAMLKHAKTQAIALSDHPVAERIAEYEKEHNTREIIGKMNQQLTDLQHVNKRLNDTVDWMHQVIYDLIEKKRALESQLESSPDSPDPQ